MAEKVYDPFKTKVAGKDQSRLGASTELGLRTDDDDEEEKRKRRERELMFGMQKMSASRELGLEQ